MSIICNLHAFRRYSQFHTHTFNTPQQAYVEMFGRLVGNNLHHANTTRRYARNTFTEKKHKHVILDYVASEPFSYLTSY